MTGHPGCRKICRIYYGDDTGWREMSCARPARRDGLCWQHHPDRPEQVRQNAARVRLEVDAMIAKELAPQAAKALPAGVFVPRPLLVRVAKSGRDGYGHAGAKDCDGCAALAELDALLKGEP